MRERRKHTLKQLNRHRKELLEQFYYKNYVSLQEIVRQTEQNTVLQFYVLDVFLEILNQLRSKGTTTFFNLVVESIQQNNKKCEDWKKGYPQPKM